MSQPKHNHCTCGKVYPKPSDSPLRNAFGYIPVGTVFIYKERKVIKITNAYFNVYSDNKELSPMMVNAMTEIDGELLHVPDGLVVEILC